VSRKEKSAAGVASYDFARKVRPEERDRNLARQKIWPPAVPPKSWVTTRYGMKRRIERVEGRKSSVPTPIEETVLRFPSAPIHGLQRLHEHHMNLDSSELFHTFRVLGSTSPAVQRRRVSRIFLMHTGLNENSTMEIYYRLASQLICQDEGREGNTICIVRPFPGHLTRYPFQAFGETPLDLYLWDGSQLFRQFMRFMIETRWLLSAIVRRSSYRCASGADLLAENDVIEESRLNDRVLAKAIQAERKGLQKASLDTAKREERNAAKAGTDQDGGGRMSEINSSTVRVSEIEASIRGLRKALRLDRFVAKTGDLLATDEPEPSLHVIGYSLGGSAAQSVFMSWPFLISSCSSMLAGGALRDLAPTGFADPEEWQTVLHSLRYELDNRMMTLADTTTAVGGIDTDLFTYFTRTFYEVFQQEYKGSIQTRYEAFSDRMFFIVGGDDPVMRPETVLQSGPKGGLNLLEISGLGHFLHDGRGANGDDQKQGFWVPEISALIDRFSDNAAEQHRAEQRLSWFDKTMRKPLLNRSEWQRLTDPTAKKWRSEEGQDPDERLVRPLLPAEWVKVEQDGALPEEIFEHCLDDLLYRIWKGGENRGGDGVLFVLRNEVPTVLLPAEAVRETASALYHDDYNIVRYCHGVAARRKVLTESIDRFCLTLPWNARRIMTRMDTNRTFPSQAESAGGRNLARSLTDDELWRRSLLNCLKLTENKHGNESVRKFDGNDSEDGLIEALEKKHGYGLEKLAKLSGDFTHADPVEPVSSLPDCWIWLSSKALSLDPVGRVDLRRAIGGLVNFTLDNIAANQGDNEQEVREKAERLLTAIRNDEVRILDVSRARYNPRFRGRLVVDEKAARRSLMHATLCVSLSERIDGSNKAKRDTIFT
jgi:hypothetical protein